MKRSLALLLVVALAGFAGRAIAQPASSAALVDVETKLSKTGELPGAQLEVAVILRVKDGWHINAHQPTLDYLIGTRLDLEPTAGFAVTEIDYPEPEMVDFSFSGEPLAVYEEDVLLFLTVRIAEEVSPGSYTLDGRLRVQACNDRICLAPSTIEVSIPVPVVEPGAATETINRDIFPLDGPHSDTEAAAASVGDNLIERMFGERGMLLAFLGIFVIGLALNLTPCVYPMLSVTVSLFGGQGTSRLERSFGRASLYLLGIVSMYSLLGVAAALTGSLFGSLLQSPWILGGIGVLLLILALSMFGLYEIQLPVALRSRLGAAQQATGPLGTYLAGVLVGVFAAPCIGPPVIALLAFVGAQGSPVFGLASFSTLALGLGLPYLVLGTFSGLLGRLPRSGVWMVWIKKLFGVVLVGAALFYIGLALFPAKAIYTVPVTLIIGGLYLGFLERSARQTRIFRRITWGIGAAAIILGVLAFQRLEKPGLSWQLYSQEVLDVARTAGEPVLLDFTADWCIPCLELDRVTFTDPRVIEALGAFVRVKVDLTHYDSPEAEALRKSYDVAGVPTLVFLNRRGEELSGTRIVGFIGPDAFLEHVNKVQRQLKGPPDQAL